MVKRIAAEFSRLGARTPNLPATRLAEREADICVKDVTEPMPVTQSKLCIGYNCGISPRSAEYADLRLFCAIFGGSPFSKLFNNVREKLSLAYYVFSVIEGHKSCMKISSGIEADKFRAAYDEINVQLEKMKAGDFTDDEIESAKKYLSLYEELIAAKPEKPARKKAAKAEEGEKKPAARKKAAKAEEGEKKPAARKKTAKAEEAPAEAAEKKPTRRAAKPKAEAGEAEKKPVRRTRAKKAEPES